MKWYGDEVKQQISENKQKVLTKVGLVIEARAKMKAPVKSGNLQGSITSSVEGDYTEVGTNVDYALRIEYGGSRQAPEGYLRPALDESKQEVMSIAKELGEIRGG